MRSASFSSNKVSHKQLVLVYNPASLGGVYFCCMTSNDIPVEFEYEGMMFYGYLSKVTGGGSSALYHLMINRRYWGQLFKTSDGWRFASNDGMFEEDYMQKFFADTIEAHLRGS